MSNLQIPIRCSLPCRACPNGRKPSRRFETQVLTLRVRYSVGCRYVPFRPNTCLGRWHDNPPWLKSEISDLIDDSHCLMHETHSVRLWKGGSVGSHIWCASCNAQISMDTQASASVRCIGFRYLMPSTLATPPKEIRSTKAAGTGTTRHPSILRSFSFNSTSPLKIKNIKYNYCCINVISGNC